jgi:hypothetical protein
MREETFEEDLDLYWQSIIEIMADADPLYLWDNQIPAVFLHIQALCQDDLVKVAIRLLEDERREVRLNAIRFLYLYWRKDPRRTRDNRLSIGVMRIALQQKDAREDALSALWRVGTRLVLPQLLLFADKGYSSALYMVRRMLRTPEEIERGIAIAQKHIGAKEYALREAALFLLQKYSTMEKEAERVLVTVQQHKDELFIDALKGAPVELVLEPLKTLRASIDARFVAHGDLSSTIKVLEQREKSG